MEDDPFLETLNIISKVNTENNNKEAKDNIFELFTQNQKSKTSLSENQVANNKIENEEEEDQEKPIEKNASIISNSLLQKKSKPDNEIEPPPLQRSPEITINSVNKIKKQNIENHFTMTNDSISDNRKIIMKQKYDYGYEINLGDGDEQEGFLMEYYLKKETNSSSTSDIFNFNLDEKSWVKIVNHSIFAHYERHLKEIFDKQQQQNKQQQMFYYINPNPTDVNLMMGNNTFLANNNLIRQMYINNNMAFRNNLNLINTVNGVNNNNNTMNNK